MSIVCPVVVSLIHRGPRVLCFRRSQWLSALWVGWLFVVGNLRPFCSVFLHIFLVLSLCVWLIRMVSAWLCQIDAVEQW